MRRGSALVLAALWCGLAVCSCAPSKPARAGELPPADPRARFFQLTGGVFEQVPGPAAFHQRTPVAWTVQERVADLAFLGDALWLAVNGRGLASVAPGDPPSFTARYDEWLFPYRTITTLVPRPDAGSLLCHLYYNAALNTVGPEALKAADISFLSFSTRLDDYAILLPPFQRGHPGWEAVGLAPLSDRDFLVEWKLAAEETSFAWTRFLPDENGEGEATRAAFQRALAYVPGDAAAVPSGVKGLFDACAAELAARGVRAGTETSVLYVARARDEPLKATFRAGTGDTFVTVPVFLEQTSGRALLPGGRVLSLAVDGTLRTLDLPALPRGFRYTDLARFGGFLVAPWEEVRFTDVGAAGILFYPVDP